jgi:hypothetical protein
MYLNRLSRRALTSDQGAFPAPLISGLELKLEVQVCLKGICVLTFPVFT